MKMNEKIKQKRKGLRLTQDEVAKRIGVSRVSITNWESSDKGRTRPKGEHLLKLAQVLQCSPDWLVDDKAKEEPKLDKTESYKLGGFETWDSSTPLSDDEIEIPFYKEVELAAGNGMIVQREDGDRKLRFAKSTLRRAGVDPAAAACVSVTGDSMMPVLPDGATVGIDTSNKRIKDGEMYAIDHDGQLRVKVLHRIGGTGIRLHSFNTTHYPDEDYQTDQAKSIKVIGRVFWYSVLR